MTRTFAAIEIDLWNATEASGCSRDSREVISRLCAEYLAAVESSKTPTLESLPPVELPDDIDCLHELADPGEQLESARESYGVPNA